MQRYILTSFKKEILYLHLDLCIPKGQIWYKSKEQYLSHINYNWQKIHCYRLTKFCQKILNDIFRFQLVHIHIDITYLFGKKNNLCQTAIRWRSHDPTSTQNPRNRGSDQPTFFFEIRDFFFRDFFFRDFPWEL